MKGPFITDEAARQATVEAAASQRFVPPVPGLAGASAGEPVLVRDLDGDPSYWLVPLQDGDRLVGFARVTGTGTIAAIGGVRGADAVATTVTGLDRNEAMARATELLDDDEVGAPPVYVHDGPPGREAWLVETATADRPGRWIFVTPGGIYTRRIGERIDTSFE